MPVKIDIKPVAIVNKIEKAWDKCVGELSSQILKDCNEYCKEAELTLVNSSLIHSQLDKGLLIWNTPYAARQYYAIETAYKTVNPKATWRWCDVAKVNHHEEWEKQAQAIKRYYE